MMKLMATPQVVTCPTKLELVVAQKPPRLVRWGCHPSALGAVLVGLDEADRLVRLDFVLPKASKANIERRLKVWRRKWQHTELVRDQKATAPIVKRVTSRKRWAKQKAAVTGTKFQTKVWQALARIPYGQLVSYADIARKIGQPKAVRAVGSAVGSNPVSVIIPCHRVIGTDGGLHGFGWGLPMKRALLRAEGAKHPDVTQKKAA